MSEWERCESSIKMKKLKHLDDIDEIIAFGFSEALGGDLFVNDSMKLRFGDNQLYPYKRIWEGHDNWADMGYTHMSDDGYFYRYTWFEEELILKLDDKDFEL